MPETFNPVTLANGVGVPLNAAYFNRLETALETLDDRGSALERGVSTPVSIDYASDITPDAAAGSLFRCTATGDLTLNAPTNGVDGQTIVVEIRASGGDRTISFDEDIADAVSVTSGQRWRGTLTYDADDDTWVLVD